MAASIWYAPGRDRDSAPGTGLVGGHIDPAGTSPAGDGVTLQAIEIHWPTPVALTETWTDHGDQVIEVEGHWLPGEDRIHLEDSSANEINTLAVCSRLHPTDSANIAHCGSCARDACPACPGTEQLGHTCGICHQPACYSCLPSGKACLLCGRPACRACLDGANLCPACRGEGAE